MKRTTVKMGTVEYPVCYSTYAISRLCEEFGSLQAMAETIKANSNDVGELIHVICTQLQILIDAGVRYSRLIGEEAPDAPDVETLTMLCGMDDIQRIQIAISEAMTADSKTTVDIEPEKNAETAAAQ